MADRQRHEPILDWADEDHGHGGASVYRRRSAMQRADHAEDHAYRDDDGDDYFDDGEPEGLVERLMAAPGRVIIGAASLAAFVVVAVNAAYLQPGAHPSPMLATRDAAPAEALVVSRLETDTGTPRSILEPPAPILPPDRTYDRAELAGDRITASIPAPAPRDGMARAPYAAPSPVPRPRMAAIPAPIPTASTNVASAPVSTTPVSVAPVVNRVETIAVTDPIAALLAPVVSQQATAPVDPAIRGAEPERGLVAAVQNVLAELGYAPGSIDGVVGPSTEEAIRRFQLRRALEPNGRITPELLQEIERLTGERISAS